METINRKQMAKARMSSSDSPLPAPGSLLLAPRSPLLAPRLGFTLVELLVVITIIGILAALIVTAAVGAMGRAQETRIKTEINQIDTAFMEYKNKITAFPPNCQTDGSDPIDEAIVLQDLKRHLSQVAGRNQESDNLLRVIAGLPAVDPGKADYPRVLEGGMSAGEALVFWLSGFSSDPKYPISGEGGPSYIGSGAAEDPIESRNWVFPFDVGRLVPRDANKYFDQSAGRYITYTTRFNGGTQLRRINFWQYAPAKSEQPYLYFDTSRHPPTAAFDPPAAAVGNLALHVHAFKKLSESTGASWPFQFVNPDKFQVLHSGRDEDWGEEAFERMSHHGVQESGDDPADMSKYLFFPEGPFIGGIADTIVNFTTETKIEDAQP